MADPLQWEATCKQGRIAARTVGTNSEFNPCSHYRHVPSAKGRMDGKPSPAETAPRSYPRPKLESAANSWRGRGPPSFSPITGRELGVLAGQPLYGLGRDDWDHRVCGAAHRRCAAHARDCNEELAHSGL